MGLFGAGPGLSDVDSDLLPGPFPAGVGNDRCRLVLDPKKMAKIGSFLRDS